MSCDDNQVGWDAERKRKRHDVLDSVTCDAETHLDIREIRGRQTSSTSSEQAAGEEKEIVEHRTVVD